MWKRVSYGEPIWICRWQIRYLRRDRHTGNLGIALLRNERTSNIV